MSTTGPLALAPIEPEIEQLAASAGEAAAPRFEKIFQLVRLLQSRGPPVLVSGIIFPRPPYKLTLIRGEGASVDVWIDAYDLDEAGEAALHYRMQIRREGSKLSKDIRTADMNEADRRIRITLGIKDEGPAAQSFP
ncbi:MAG TPA: hypothetical protein VHV55_28405 [Pirellulales bacterium]|nr:hypothetical protein [Pirellulales bacterium]